MTAAMNSPSARQWGLLYAAAVASFVPTFGYYLVGEEGILVNSSLEMWQRGDWLRLWFYGSDAQHGVLANWLIIPVASAVGWAHAPGVARAIMAGATALNGVILALLAYRLYQDKTLAVIAAVICVTFADVLFYRGWLGYRDPLFGMLVFGAIASLWMAVHSARAVWLVGTLALVTCAFLTKGILAYLFVGAAVLVFLLQHEPRKFLLRPMPLLLAVATLCLPYVWFHWIIGDQAQGGRMATEIGAKLVPLGVGAYLWKLLAYPLETVVRLAPVSLLGGWWLWRRKFTGACLTDRGAMTALAIAGIAFIPFWLAPQSHFRYLFPILPLLALACAVCVARQGEQSRRVAWRWLWAAVGLKLLIAVALFPYYQSRVRGENYAQAARQVLQRTAGFSLYSNDVSAAGLSVTAYMNIQRLPQPVLTFTPTQWDNGFAVSNIADAKLGKIAAQYPLGSNVLYLYCRGAACETPALR
jgi:4-amino-4-deoxy-L-arabinose transferase-like glycosyltransferase